MTTTRAQRLALKRIHQRDPSLKYRAFRRSCVTFSDYVLAPFAGMWLGVERDGYTHS